MRDGAATDAGFGDGCLKFDISEEAAPEVFRLRAKPAHKAPGLLSFLSRPHCGRRLNPRRALLVYPYDGRFFHLGVLLPEFAGCEAERNALWLREIRRQPFSLSGGVTRRGENILLLRHGRISCVRRMTRKPVDLRFTADIGRATKVLGKCRAGGK